MTIKRKLQQKVPKIEIDLTGPKGNVFVLMKAAKQLASKVGVDGDRVVSRMMKGSYADAVNIFEAYFSDYVTLYVDDTVQLN